MENSNRNKIELFRLVAVLEKILDATTKTMKLLHESCDEAQNLLNNWHIPDTSVPGELPHCTCNDDDEDDYSKIIEVAKDIEQVVEQAQKLRETLSASKPQAKGLLLTKKPNTGKICQLGFTSKKLNDKVQKKTPSAKFSSVKPLTTGNGSLKRMVNNSVVRRSSPDNHSPRATQTNTSWQSIPIPILSGNCDKKSVIKPRLKPNLSLQTTYQKDFSIHTDSSTTRHKIVRSCFSKPKESSVKDENTAMSWSKNTNALYVKNMERDTKLSNSTSFSEKMGISDLEDLLSQVIVYPNVSVKPDIKKSTTPPVKLNYCLLHSDKTAHITKSDYRAVKLAEAVDVLGVPSDLIKALKTYHSFFERRQRGKKCGIDAGKGKVAARSFLNKLSTMNDASWKKFAYEPLVELFMEYAALLSEVSRLMECKFKEKNDELLAGLQKKYEHLENKYSLEEMQYIQYSSEFQWKKLDENVQEIQMLEFQTEVFEVLELHIFPQLFTYSSQDPTFPKLYRTLCSLCNLARLTSPIIIKSC
ncbi:uncharacterized protein LOC111871633 isoform X3 [Cryptotermes secundus]|uniref:uncharacterized protein LOC111871633 isoform X3 n=1 Tax=Cryptotermes secundus TaxID=105785 RepID=UPI000CD7C6BA|nr:uncharacterized protein LOC111871633 isoform X3 [Cryptotermes secundus]